MKCLEKDRTRRYETANGFAMDVQRYLADEPVLACPPSAGYRFKKFVRRNKGPVLAVTVVLLSLVGGIVGTTIGFIRADNARAAESAERANAENARDHAWDALDAMTSRVTGDSLGTQQVVAPEQKEFCEQRWIRTACWRKAGRTTKNRGLERRTQRDGSDTSSSFSANSNARRNRPDRRRRVSQR